jgi:multiple sugar transport system substrate-binding protein
MNLAKRGAPPTRRRLTSAAPSKRHAVAALAVGVVAAVALSACSSSKPKSSSTTAAGATTGTQSSSAASQPAPSGGGASGSGASGALVDSSSVPKGTITVVAADYGAGTSAQSGADWWAAVVKAFNEKYPQVTVKMNVVNWNDVDKQITTEVQAGNPPDIAQASADWTGLQDQVYKASDVLTPAAQSNLIESFAKQGNIGDAEYGIPWIASSRALVYNKDLFQKAGISAPPTSWAEYQSDAQKLKSAGVPQPACIPLGNEEAQAEALIWELGNGGGFVDSSGNWALNSQANVDTFKFINTLVQAGVTNPHPATTNRTAGCWADFQAGKVGMTNSQPAELPGLTEAQQKSNLNFAFAPIPGKDGLAKTTLGVNDWIWAFKGKSDHQMQDKAFLSFVMSDQWQRSFFDAYKLLPITKGASEQVAQANPDLKPFLDSLPTDTFYPVNQKAWAQVNAQIKQIIGQAVSSDPSKILDQLQNTAKSNS